MFQRNRYQNEAEMVEVGEKDLTDKVCSRTHQYVCRSGCRIRVVKYSNIMFILQARQINIHNLATFYDSEVFKNNHFRLDEKRRVIIFQV